ncbi:mitochondrial 37S ribosomal protein mS46 RSM28 Ecym_3591 [Eremothecium cymbalariae DBVPG|uniref:37S ribosomal protein RSM28, mitochondrial n=1 Tax=Eremothecium cymbalariae (strain CBS 270.75 / DBVPG 7215 / KCTC 17166 / NRRL Y-17582) TaxID=931890 RepID=G8JQS3_ERECY|nr:Hypothetical protein Ecym_3591 [Eremothecium cymbalariae DBVPG\
MLRSTFSHISKRFSSSKVSSEYLQSLLQRVQEVKILSHRNLDNRSRNRPQKASSQGNTRPRKPRNHMNHANLKSQTGRNIISTSKVNSSVKRRSPKLKEYADNNNIYNDLVSNISDKARKTSAHGKQVKSSGKMSKKTVPGLIMKKQNVNNELQMFSHSENYCPSVPTRLSLLKYMPNLGINYSSKLTNYAVESLKESRFPFHRPFNSGMSSTDQGSITNERVILKPQDNGMVKLDKEPLTENFKVPLDYEYLKSFVKGRYEELDPYTADAFAEIVNTKSRQKELLANSEIVRLSVQQSNMKVDQRKLLFEVCSGLKKVSALKQ